ncbi:uncharacterized protein LOC127240018 [Andrographis paniculata]|uniref:uncharacterized protein LOC127240018 n=1 Tax=Andrographis paniculata TaxID=175694 RepID=UPI0021E71273|nr:uncharacterized protein LOC127240018 [Andrographis paniculata]
MNFILLLLIWTWLLASLSTMSAQLLSSASLREARALDALLQGFAYQAFTRPRTGVVYIGVVPSNLTGTKVSAMRLRSGSLRTRGVKMYEEFEIPKGVIEQPYVERLVLVYQNLGNWSMTYYPLQGYTYLAPVLGLLAYDASDLNARNLRELDIRASGEPISVHFSGLRRPVPDGLVPKCVLVNLNGTVSLSNVSSDNICVTFQEGHISIVVESVEVPPSPPPPPALSKGRRRQGSSDHSKAWIIAGAVLGGFTLLVVLGLIAVWASKYKHGKKMHQMERAADVGEALHMTSLGNTKAPAATGTRTQPMLETEYVP